MDPDPLGSADCVTSAVSDESVVGLSDDALLHILDALDFASLLSLKQVSRSCASLSRHTLTQAPQWARAKDFCAQLSTLHWTPTDSITCGDEIIARHNEVMRAEASEALLADDTHTMNVLLHLGLLDSSTTNLDGDHWLALHQLGMPRAIGQCTGHRPLHLAQSAAMVDLLMMYSDMGREEVNARRFGGRTALMDACDQGCADVVRALCSHGADVNLKDVPGGVGALFYAEQCQQRGGSPRGVMARMADSPAPLPRASEHA